MRPDGTQRDPVTIWVVRTGDDLYVRSYRGTGGAWYRNARARRQAASRPAASVVRATIPRFSAENRTANQALVDHVAGLAAAKGATPGQIALAWLLAQRPWIAPIPGTRRRKRLAENAGATQVPLSADEVVDLNTTAARIGVHGNRYNDAHMSLIGR